VAKENIEDGENDGQGKTKEPCKTRNTAWANLEPTTFPHLLNPVYSPIRLNSLVL
jgi:hypothetical protein